MTGESRKRWWGGGSSGTPGWVVVLSDAWQYAGNTWQWVERDGEQHEALVRDLFYSDLAGFNFQKLTPLAKKNLKKGSHVSR